VISCARAPFRQRRRCSTSDARRNLAAASGKRAAFGCGLQSELAFREDGNLPRRRVVVHPGGERGTNLDFLNDVAGCMHGRAAQTPRAGMTAAVKRRRDAAYRRAIRGEVSTCGSAAAWYTTLVGYICACSRYGLAIELLCVARINCDSYTPARVPLLRRDGDRCAY